MFGLEHLAGGPHINQKQRSHCDVQYIAPHRHLKHQCFSTVVYYCKYALFCSDVRIRKKMKAPPPAPNNTTNAGTSISPKAITRTNTNMQHLQHPTPRPPSTIQQQRHCHHQHQPPETTTALTPTQPPLLLIPPQTITTDTTPTATANPVRREPDVLRPGICRDARVYGHTTTAFRDIEHAPRTTNPTR